jgi:hypothetical protein
MALGENANCDQRKRETHNEVLKENLLKIVGIVVETEASGKFVAVFISVVTQIELIKACLDVEGSPKGYVY